MAPKARPHPQANLVVLRAQDGYVQSLPLADLLARDVLLADRLDGRRLPIAHGAPLRFVGPRFMDHPRARVALEERGRLPARLLRAFYPALVPPIRWLFRVALERHQRRRAAAPEPDS